MSEGIGFNLMIEGIDPKLAVPSTRTLGRYMDLKYDLVTIFPFHEKAEQSNNRSLNFQVCKEMKII